MGEKTQQVHLVTSNLPDFRKKQDEKPKESICEPIGAVCGHTDTMRLMVESIVTNLGLIVVN